MQEVIVDHRAWYRALALRLSATPVAVPLGIDWGLVSAGRTCTGGVLWGACR